MKKNREGRAKSFRDAEDGFSRPTKKQGKRRTNPPFTATKPLFEARIRKKRIPPVTRFAFRRNCPEYIPSRSGNAPAEGNVRRFRERQRRNSAERLRVPFATIRAAADAPPAGPGRKKESRERQAPSKSGLRNDPAARKTLRHTAHGTGGNERPFVYAYDPKRTAGESRPAARVRGAGTDFEFSERLGSEV